MAHSSNLSDHLAQLTSRDLRAIIESVAATSNEVATIMEIAVSQQLEAQRRRRAQRKLEASEIDGGPSTRSSNGGDQLTPLYTMLFDAAEEQVLIAAAAMPSYASSARSAASRRDQAHLDSGQADQWPSMASANGGLQRDGGGSAKPGWGGDRGLVPLGIARSGGACSGGGSHSSGSEGTRQPPRKKAPAAAGNTGREIEPLPRAIACALDDALGRQWKGGFIFFCRHDSFKETFEKKVFGLARHKFDLLGAIEPGATALFLFDQTFRYLHGVFEASSPPGLDLDESYLKQVRPGMIPLTNGGRMANPAAVVDHVSPFPAQVCFERLHDFTPLEEIKFCHLVGYNTGTNIFRHRLGAAETQALLSLMARPEEAPTDNELPYEKNGYKRLIPESPRFYEQRRAAYGHLTAV